MPHNPEHISERLYQGPLKYIQGPSAFRNAGRYLSPLGDVAFLICDSLVHKIAGNDLISTLRTASLGVVYAEFVGEISTQEINRLVDLVQKSRVDFVVGLGGGKTLDCAKVIAQTLGIPLACLPTIAATDAPCSAVSVVYTPDGHFDHYKFMKKNPDVVLVDTSIISRAPARFLASGMGDAIATHIEAKACRQSVIPWGGLPTEVSNAIGEKCEEVLLKYGKLAYEANKSHSITPAFEAVVEANTLLSGLGFESGGVAAAHSIHNGLTAIDALHGLLHGEKVAFGVVVHLILINAPSSELDKYIAFMLSVNLPVTFELLGIPNVTDEEIRAVAKLACSPGETIWTMDIGSNITDDKVFHAIKGADAASRDFIRNVNYFKAKL